MGDINIPKEPLNPSSPFIRTLTIAAAALTAGSIAVNLILQIAQFARKRPVQPDQRDTVQAASLALTVLRTLPGLVRQVRLLVHVIKSA